MQRNPVTEIIIGFLAVLSIILIALEPLAELSPGGLTAIYIVDGVICVIFAGDFIYRFYHAENKLKFFKYNGYEILAMIPAVAFSTIATGPAISEGLRAIRLIRVVVVFARTARFIKLSGGFIKRSRFVSLFVITITIIFIAAFIVLLLERNVADPRITSFADAIWWSISTVTTVGYGDIVPVSAAGRIVGMLLMIVGIAVMTAFIAQVSATIVESRLQPFAEKNLKATVKQEIKKNIDKLDKLSDEEVQFLIQMIHSVRQQEGDTKT
jgi:voltage-gated potassium channel